MLLALNVSADLDVVSRAAAALHVQRLVFAYRPVPCRATYATFWSSPAPRACFTSKPEAGRVHHTGGKERVYHSCGVSADRP
ncbi:hypothetical protein PUR59_13975 [Streptomyces sp. SP18ES09]|uniref:hypothetical protein n=1 Tax=Streptomyces sp. SP18ES09 TaxID=3002532 RepID=UPI002E78384E|nr:hypothetical protein [Streptomyces sp. SP18ES09]MEE1816116.1 hypothetical protein [Streptomyces sp. SP18ES09]